MSNLTCNDDNKVLHEDLGIKKDISWLIPNCNMQGIDCNYTALYYKQIMMSTLICVQRDVQKGPNLNTF